MTLDPFHQFLFVDEFVMGQTIWKRGVILSLGHVT